MAGYHHNAALVLYHELDAVGELACNVIARGAGGRGREGNMVPTANDVSYVSYFCFMTGLRLMLMPRYMTPSYLEKAGL